MAIRELTEDEANFVSGSGDIVVVGRREYQYGTQYYDPGLGSHYESNSTPVENAFDSWSYNYPANFDYGLDVASDKAATFIFDKIAQRPDANKVEYSGFVWVGADHKVHTTELIRGSGASVDYSGITPQSIGGPGFTNWNQVVGVVHNHPSLWEVRYSDGSYKLDSNGQHVWEANPLANNPSAGDMVNLTYFANLAGGVDNVNVKSYIQMPSGIKEFDAAANVNLVYPGENPQTVADRALNGDFMPYQYGVIGYTGPEVN